MFKKLVKFLLSCMPADRFISKGNFSTSQTASDAIDIAEENKVKFVGENKEVYEFEVEGKTGKHKVFVSVPSRIIERHLNHGTPDLKVLRSRRFESKIEYAVLVCAIEEYSRERGKAST